MIPETVELMNEFKAKYKNHEKQCYKCKYYIENYKDDFTLRHFGYGEVRYRSACSHYNTFSFVDINHAPLCRDYKFKNQS